MSQPHAGLPQVVDRDAPIFTISVAAHLAGMHPQTLRGYDKLGLVQPRRARGRGRRYSMRDIHRLRLIQHLSQNDGVNLTGIQRILQMDAEIERLNHLVETLTDQRDAARAQAAASSRVFTAETSGAVHLGRVVQRQRALPAR